MNTRKLKIECTRCEKWAVISVPHCGVKFIVQFVHLDPFLLEKIERIPWLADPLKNATLRSTCRTCRYSITTGPETTSYAKGIRLAKLPMFGTVSKSFIRYMFRKVNDHSARGVKEMMKGSLNYEKSARDIESRLQKDKPYDTPERKKRMETRQAEILAKTNKDAEYQRGLDAFKRKNMFEAETAKLMSPTPKTTIRRVTLKSALEEENRKNLDSSYSPVKAFIKKFKLGNPVTDLPPLPAKPSLSSPATPLRHNRPPKSLQPTCPPCPAPSTSTSPKPTRPLPNPPASFSPSSSPTTKIKSAKYTPQCLRDLKISPSGPGISPLKLKEFRDYSAASVTPLPESIILERRIEARKRFIRLLSLSPLAVMNTIEHNLRQFHFMHPQRCTYHTYFYTHGFSSKAFCLYCRSPFHHHLSFEDLKRTRPLDRCKENLHDWQHHKGSACDLICKHCSLADPEDFTWGPLSDTDLSKMFN